MSCVKDCSCPVLNCKNHGKCCDCVKQHRDGAKLPNCLRMPLNKYLLKKEYDKEKIIFNEQCKRLEDNIPDITKGKLFAGDDGSEVQAYFLKNEEITVHNSFYFGELYVLSNLDLTQYPGALLVI